MSLEVQKREVAEAEREAAEAQRDQVRLRSDRPSASLLALSSIAHAHSPHLSTALSQLKRELDCVVGKNCEAPIEDTGPETWECASAAEEATLAPTATSTAGAAVAHKEGEGGGGAGNGDDCFDDLDVSARSWKHGFQCGTVLLTHRLLSGVWVWVCCGHRLTFRTWIPLEMECWLGMGPLKDLLATLLIQRRKQTSLRLARLNLQRTTRYPLTVILVTRTPRRGLMCPRPPCNLCPYHHHPTISLGLLLALPSSPK